MVIGVLHVVIGVAACGDRWCGCMQATVMGVASENNRVLANEMARRWQKSVSLSTNNQVQASASCTSHHVRLVQIHMHTVHCCRHIATPITVGNLQKYEYFVVDDDTGGCSSHAIDH